MKNSPTDFEIKLSKGIELIHQLLVFLVFVIAVEAIAGGPQLTTINGILIIGAGALVSRFILVGITSVWIRKAGLCTYNESVFLMVSVTSVAILSLIASFIVYTFGMEPSYLSTSLSTLLAVALFVHQTNYHFTVNGETIIGKE